MKTIMQAWNNLPPLTNPAEEEKILKQYIKVISYLTMGGKINSSSRFFISCLSKHSLSFDHFTLIFITNP